MACLFFFKAFDNLGYNRDLNPKIACSYPEILQLRERERKTNYASL